MQKIEMSNMKASSPKDRATDASPVEGYTREKHEEFLKPLNTALADLRNARGNLASAARLAINRYPKLSASFWKQGDASHHTSAPKRIDNMGHVAKDNLSENIIGALKKYHAAIPPAIDAVKLAHERLLSEHPNLAEKGGKPNARTRTFISVTGVPVSLGNYHGKKHTDPGNGSTIVKGISSRLTPYESGAPHARLYGGKRKTRKHRRKHKRKTRKHKRKRKTKKRKRRRKHKKKTRRR
jgi:hypothetical protein